MKSVNPSDGLCELEIATWFNNNGRYVLVYDYSRHNRLAVMWKHCLTKYKDSAPDPSNPCPDPA